MVFLLCPQPCCQFAPTLPHLVANNIPLLCTQLSQTILAINPSSTQNALISQHVELREVLLFFLLFYIFLWLQFVFFGSTTVCLFVCKLS